MRDAVRSFGWFVIFNLSVFVKPRSTGSSSGNDQTHSTHVMRRWWHVEPETFHIPGKESVVRSNTKEVGQICKNTQRLAKLKFIVFQSTSPTHIYMRVSARVHYDVVTAHITSHVRCHHKRIIMILNNYTNRSSQQRHTKHYCSATSGSRAAITTLFRS